jgi:hypothetical protein
VGRLHIGAAELLASADELLGTLTRDKKDLSPPLRYYTAGGPKHLTAVGIRYVGQAAWDEGRRGEGLWLLREAKARMDAALAAGLMHAPWQSLHGRVAADIADGQQVLGLYDKDNRTVYFDLVPAAVALPEAAFAASAADPFVLPPPLTPSPPPGRTPPDDRSASDAVSSPAAAAAAAGSRVSPPAAADSGPGASGPGSALPAAADTGSQRLPAGPGPRPAGP